MFVSVFSEKIPASRTPKRTEAKRKRESGVCFFLIAKFRECWTRALKEKEKRTKDLGVDNIAIFASSTTLRRQIIWKVVEVFSDGRLVCFPTPLPLPLFGSCKRFPTLFLVLCAWHLTSSPLDAHPFPLAGRGGSWNCFGGPSLRLARSKPYVFRVFKKVVEQNWTCGDYFKGVCSQVFCMAFVLLLLYADSLIAFLLCWLVSCSSLLQP